MNKITDFAYYLTDFLTNYLIAGKGNSNNTVKSYSYTFLLLLKYMKEVKNRDADRISLEDINKDNILGFLDWLQVCRKCGNSTRNQRLVAITEYSDESVQPFWTKVYNCGVEKLSLKSNDFLFLFSHRFAF